MCLLYFNYYKCYLCWYSNIEIKFIIYIIEKYDLKFLINFRKRKKNIY